MGAFLIFVGLCLVAWSVFYVGRRIARLLLAIGIILERNDDNRREMEAQLERL